MIIMLYTYIATFFIGKGIYSLFIVFLNETFQMEESIYLNCIENKYIFSLLINFFFPDYMITYLKKKKQITSLEKIFYLQSLSDQGKIFFSCVRIIINNNGLIIQKFK